MYVLYGLTELIITFELYLLEIYKLRSFKVKGTYFVYVELNILLNGEEVLIPMARFSYLQVK